MRWFMIKRRQQAIVGLLLFVLGTLIVPAMHKLELARPAGSISVSRCCGHAHHGRDESTTAPNVADECSGQSERHDHSSCSICQLAKTPAHTAVAAIIAPQHDFVPKTCPVAPQLAKFQTPHFFPFSCGPPA